MESEMIVFGNKHNKDSGRFFKIKDYAIVSFYSSEIDLLLSLFRRGYALRCLFDIFLRNF